MPTYRAKPPRTSLDHSHPLAADLVLAYLYEPMAQPGAGQDGIARDWSGNGNDGACVDSSSNYIASPWGGGYSSDETGSNYFEGPASDTLVNSSISGLTFAALVNPHNATDGTQGLIGTKNGGASRARLWQNGSTWVAIYRNAADGFASIASPSSTLIVDTWQLVVATFTEGAAAVYIDGISQNTATDLSATNTFDDVDSAAMTFSAAKVDTAMSMVWQRALTPHEVAQLSVDPFAMLRPRSNAVLFAATTVTAGGTILPFMQHYAA